MSQYHTDREAQLLIERTIAMTPRDCSREDFERRIERMLRCLADLASCEGGSQPFRVELLGYAGDAGARTLCFRYRLVPVVTDTPPLYKLMA